MIVPDEGEELVPCATWDPDQPAEEREGWSRLCREMRVTLRPGDMLYLPALWYVTQGSRRQELRGAQEKIGITKFRRPVVRKVFVVRSTIGMCLASESLTQTHSHSDM